MPEDTRTKKNILNTHHDTKHGMHPVWPILFIFFAVAIISMAFGMLLFPVIADVCAGEILIAVANIGYAGVFLLFVGLMLEAYNLYEHHQKHVTALVVVGIIMCALTAGLLLMLSQTFTCG